jgi:hypothetical protein
MAAFPFLQCGPRTLGGALEEAAEAKVARVVAVVVVVEEEAPG